MTREHYRALPAVPGRLAPPRQVLVSSLAAVLAGSAALAWAFARGEAQLAWSAYLIGAFFALGLGAFAVAWLSMLYLAGADWSVTMRRIPEAMTAWLIPGGLLTMAVALGAHPHSDGTDFALSAPRAQRVELALVDEEKNQTNIDTTGADNPRSGPS